MPTGAITSYIDVAQIVLYVFWGFFALLILYLRREDKREGYPLESDRSPNIRVQGFPATPRPKVFTLSHGASVSAPSGKVDRRSLNAQPIGPWLGAPLEPLGDPMQDGVGPAAHAERAEVPDLTIEGLPRIVPLRSAPGFSVESRDPDPRGMEVVGGDGLVGGVVRDVWVDRSEPQVRYLEVETQTATGTRSVLLPMGFVRVDRRRRLVRVRSILARHFAAVPPIASPDQITLREEDRIMAYYGGGTLYAKPSRVGPLL